MSSDTHIKHLKLIETILFLGLCCLSTYFMWGVLVKFFAGETSFSQYEDRITAIPTVTFCFIKSDAPKKKYKYETDFTIEYFYKGSFFRNTTIMLAIGENSNTLGETVNLQRLITYILGYCYKISVANPSVNHNRAFYIYYKNETIAEKDLPTVKVYITSEENAYGVVVTHWRDGKYVTTQIDRNMVNYVALKQDKYQYLAANGKCSHETFYECFSQQLALRLGESKCSPKVSLPSLPICKTKETYEASLKAVYDVLPKIESLSAFENGVCPKLCSRVDYNGELKIGKRIEDLPYKTNATFVLDYKFKQSSVTVYKEYVIYDAISMIGSVGGTLGMCIGFSFTGAIAYMINLVHNVFLEFRQKSAKHKSRIQNYSNNNQKLNFDMQNIDKYKQLKMEMNDKFKEQGNALLKISTKLEEIESKMF